MHLKLSGKIILRKLLISREFLWILTPALKTPFLAWGSGYWPVPFSSDEALQIGGLFHQSQFPYCCGYEPRRVQHFPDFNLESIFIIENIFIMKNPTNFGKRVETGVDPCLPNCLLGESPTTSHCQVECWHV